MPPAGFRKRLRSASPVPSPPSKRKAATNPKPTTKKSKPTLFDTADAPSEKQKTVEENKKYLETLDDDDDESMLSEADSDDFEDVPPAKRQKTTLAKREADGEDDEEEMDWEDAIQASSSAHATPAAAKAEEEEIGDVSILVNEDGTYIEPLVSAATGKKGPSKRERQIRVQTHCLHVMSLMWHNTVRNSWLNDKEVQKILVDGLSEGVKKEVQRWKKALSTIGAAKQEPETKKATPVEKGKSKRGKKSEKSTGRDWNAAAEMQESGHAQHATNALLRLLKVLTAYWRKRFAVTTPGLRKQGYKDLRRLRNDIKAWEKDHKDVEEHGERVESIEDFRRLAKKCEGSRDVGAQLFVALLRGLGLQTRMVANLQPAGFGWSKGEEADPKKEKKSKKDEKLDKAESESDDDVVEVLKVKTKSSKSSKKSKKIVKEEEPSRKSFRGHKTNPISLEDSDSPLSEPQSGVEEEEDEDDISVIDISPSTPKKKPSKKYDRDLAFPNYWTEVCDPASHKFFPVDPIVLSTIASSDDLLQTFEPRGKKAEVSKQVMCYTIAFSADGTAKDVTVRYLKRHQLPGKTKGMRMPVEKVPVYNRKGKVKKYEDYDWFRTLISLYDRPESKRTAADDREQQTDLKPFKPAKEEKQVDKESLQGYKQSADFVLEQHLRREEALRPGAKTVKTFTTGKGEKATQYPVFKRSDVLVCRTVESWHKEGRAIKVGEQPIKYVPVRAVTLIRKREIEDAQRETGEKPTQGLYSKSQTDWIIPPPIENGVIPKNAFGNMDVYVPTMVPRGAVHLPLKGSAKLCRKLEINYAEACTGFEFGKQRAVPVLTGVVVAEEHEILVRDAWRADQAEMKRKEDTKRSAAALHWWRKCLLGLRVLERMRVEYADAGGKGEEVNPFVLKAKREGRSSAVEQAESGADVDMVGGGFFREGYDEEEVPQRKAEAKDGDAGGGFLVEDGDEEDGGGAGGGFLVEDDLDQDEAEGPPKNHAPITPVSLQSMHKTMDGAGDSEPDETDEPVKTISAPPNKGRNHKTTAKTNKRKMVVLSDDDDESSLSDLSSSDGDESSDGAVRPDDFDDLGANAKPSQTKTRAARRSSPQVRIPSHSKAKTPTGRKRITRAANKSTPVRSPYFDHSEEEEEKEEDESSDDEVVKPRKTTARTKRS